MGGFFGAVSKRDVVMDVFFGVDYHSHLGTRRAGMIVLDHEDGYQRQIHSIENTPFRTKFEDDIVRFHGTSAIGCISDADPQPLLVRSHLGEPAVLLSREALVAAGGFGMRPLRGIPRSRRRTLWEPLLAPSEARRSLPRRWLFLPALLLAAAFGLSVAAGRWTAAAAVVTAALVWAAAACVSRAVSGEAWSGLRRFIPIRRIFRYY